MNWVIATRWYIAAIVLICIAWDILANRYGGAEATISRQIWRASVAYPGFAFVAGVLVGHLLFSQKID